MNIFKENLNLIQKKNRTFATVLRANECARSIFYQHNVSHY